MIGNRKSQTTRERIAISVEMRRKSREAGGGEGKGVGRLTGGGGRRRMVTLMAVERKWGGVDNLTSEWEEGAG